MFIILKITIAKAVVLRYNYAIILIAAERKGKNGTA